MQKVLSKTENIITWCIVLGFVILWVTGGLSKLIGYEKFRFELGRSPYLESFAGFIAVTVPIGEIIIALMLLFNTTRLIAMYASLFLMTLFTGYVYAMIHFSYYMPCSCGGILSVFGLENNWNDHLVFNIVATILNLFAIPLVVRNQTKDETMIPQSG